MKDLRNYINEAMNYKPKYSIQDWENFIKKYCKESGNYSQLAGLDTDAFAGYMELDEYNAEEAAAEWTQDNNLNFNDNEYNIVVDILGFMGANYESKLCGYRDNLATIIDIKQSIEKDRNPVDWVVEEEDYCKIFCTNSSLRGIPAKYAQLLAKYGGRAMMPSNDMGY